MELILKRRFKGKHYTIGTLSVDGVAFCDTLEPTDRGYSPNEPQRKVPGQTAIPTGRYRVVLTHSPRFGRTLPLLVGVPGFEGVRIHAGNYPRDTQGCILVGHNTRRGMLTDSKRTLEALMERINGEEVYIVISD